MNKEIDRKRYRSSRFHLHLRIGDMTNRRLSYYEFVNFDPGFKADMKRELVSHFNVERRWFLKRRRQRPQQE